MTGAREPGTLVRVAGWIGVAAGVVTVGSALPFLAEGLAGDSSDSTLAMVAFVVVGTVGLAGIGLAVGVLLLLRHRGARVAAVVACVLGAALFPIWSTGLGLLVPPLPGWLGLLQLPVPLVVLGLAVVALLRLRGTPAASDGRHR